MSGFGVPEWGSMFVPELSLVESFLRGSIVYLSLVVLFRVVLKRQAGSLGLPDVMLVVLVSECVSASLAADARSIPNGLMAVLALLFWNYALDRLAHRWRWLQRLLEPAPLELVRNGRPIRKNMDAEGITDDELAAQLRLNGIDSVARVKSAVIESEGTVSVIPKGTDHKPNHRVPPDLEQATQRFLAALAEFREAIAVQEKPPKTQKRSRGQRSRRASR